MPLSLGEAGPITATKPLSGTNAGNWTAIFDPRTIGITLSTFECYRIVVDGGPVGSKFNVYIGTKKYDSVYPGYDTSWDPNHTMKLVQGNTVYFYWNNGSGTAPEVTMYFQETEVI